MRSYNDLLHMVFLEVNEDIMDMLEEDNDVYSTLLSQLTECQEQLDLYLEHHGFSNEIMTLFNKLRAIERKINAKEKEEFYLKGHQDCLAHMRIIAY